MKNSHALENMDILENPSTSETKNTAQRRVKRDITALTYLTPGELYKITGFRGPDEQKRWLTRNGTSYVLGRHGYALVARSILRGLLPLLRDEDDERCRIWMEKIARVYMAPMRGAVYMADEGHDDSAVKIGVSGPDPAWRITTLQIGNPRRLRRLHFERGSEALEKLFHQMLRPHNVSGEWFERVPRVRDMIAASKELGYRAALEALARSKG